MRYCSPLKVTSCISRSPSSHGDRVAATPEFGQVEDDGVKEGGDADQSIGMQEQRLDELVLGDAIVPVVGLRVSANSPKQPVWVVSKAPRARNRRSFRRMRMIVSFRERYPRQEPRSGERPRSSTIGTWIGERIVQRDRHVVHVHAVDGLSAVGDIPDRHLDDIEHLGHQPLQCPPKMYCGLALYWV